MMSLMIRAAFGALALIALIGAAAHWTDAPGEAHAWAFAFAASAAACGFEHALARRRAFVDRAAAMVAAQRDDIVEIAADLSNAAAIVAQSSARAANLAAALR